MEQWDTQDLVKALHIFILSLPFPREYDKAIRDQISTSLITLEQYPECFKMLFTINQKATVLPSKLPTLLQGGQILKDNGPLSFQLFVENGYVVQFEVVDMGGNVIDWDYFFQHTPILDIEY